MQQFVAMQLHGVHSSVCSSKCATKPFYFHRLLPAKCSCSCSSFSSSLSQDFLPRSQATFYDFSHRKQTGTVWSCKRKPFFGALSSFSHLTLSSSSSPSFQSSQLFSSKKRVGVGGGCEIIAASGKDRDKKKKEKKNTSSSGKKQGEGGGSRKAAATPKGNVWSKDFTDRTSSSNARDSQSDTRQKITSSFKNSRDKKEAKSSRLENETRGGGLSLLETEESDREVNGDRKVSRGNQLYNQAEIANPEEDYGMLLVSGTIPAEIETVLQTAEVVADPLWDTFVSSNAGVWRGVGAAFSPITAEMEPMSLGSKNEYLYDARVLCTVEPIPRVEGEGQRHSTLHRKILWTVENPHGEKGFDDEVKILSSVEGTMLLTDSLLDVHTMNDRPATSSQSDRNAENGDIVWKDVMEEDDMGMEPGLVFFSDGSYSRGPISLLPDELAVTDNYFAPPTFTIEQCLVLGGHQRLRLIHTISIMESGAEIQVLRVAVYREEWMGPCNMNDSGGHRLEPFSNEERLSPYELMGLWKVFEISATVIDSDTNKSNERPTFVYFCNEVVKAQGLPEPPSVDESIWENHGEEEDNNDDDDNDDDDEEEEEVVDDPSLLWLPGGVIAGVEAKESGILTISVGWLCADKTRLVMERDYGPNGKLAEVRLQSHIKGDWLGGRM
ncbi:unnamed protein product [Sphagnum balticum]